MNSLKEGANASSECNDTSEEQNTTVQEWQVNPEPERPRSMARRNVSGLGLSRIS